MPELSSRFMVSGFYSGGGIKKSSFAFVLHGRTMRGELNFLTKGSLSIKFNLSLPLYSLSVQNFLRPTAPARVCRVFLFWTNLS